MAATPAVMTAAPPAVTMADEEVVTMMVVPTVKRSAIVARTITVVAIGIGAVEIDGSRRRVVVGLITTATPAPPAYAN
jgi:hypothetical protein